MRRTEESISRALFFDWHSVISPPPPTDLLSCTIAAAVQLCFYFLSPIPKTRSVASSSSAQYHGISSLQGTDSSDPQKSCAPGVELGCGVSNCAYPIAESKALELLFRADQPLGASSRVAIASLTTSSISAPAPLSTVKFSPTLLQPTSEQSCLVIPLKAVVTV